MTSTRFGDQLEAMVTQYRSRLAGARRELHATYTDVVSQPTLDKIVSLRQQVHKLAGSGATFGFPAISQDALAFESMLDQLVAEFQPHRSASAPHEEESETPLPGHKILRLPEADRLRKACDRLIESILTAENLETLAVEAPEAASSLLILGIGVEKSLRRRLLSSPWLRQQSARARSFVQWYDDTAALGSKAASDIPHAVILQASAEDAPERLRFVQTRLDATLPAKARRPFIILILNSGHSTPRPEALIQLGQSGADRILELPRDDEHLDRVLGETLASHSENPYRIIMLDDDQKLCEFYAASLKRVGVDIVAVADPGTIFAAIDAVQPHLLIIDVHLGRFKGLDLAASIRQQPRWDGMPLIMLSTDASLAQITSARRRFADEYLAKPIAPSALYDAILPYLRAASRQRELVQSVTNALARERAEKEKVHQANERMALFLATVTHEIRSPLQGILGIAALLAKTDLEAGQAQYLFMMRQAGTALSALTADILDFSKMESDKLLLSLEPTSLVDICSDLAALNYEAALRHDVTLVFALDPKISALSGNSSSPVHLLLDRSRMLQILSNLITNAIRFSEGGLVTLNVWLAPEPPAESVAPSGTGNPTGNDGRTPPAAQRLLFAVGDSGRGMSPRQRAALFNPYVQVHDGDHYALGGTGLGLTIARRLVNLMGGELAVESAPGEGTTFQFELRLCTAAGAEHGRSHRQTDESRQEASSPLLIVAGNCGKMPETQRTKQLLDECTRTSGVNPRNVTTAPALAAPQMPRNTPAEPNRGAAGNTRATEDTGAGPRSMGASGDPEDRLKVLVAEDLAINRAYLEALLQEAGCLVTLAEDGSVAVKAAAATAFDLILLDCQMPVLDGYAAAAAMRAHGIKAPIYALTASSGWNERARCLARGMTDVLDKPMTQETLAVFLAKSGMPRLAALAHRLIGNLPQARLRSLSGFQGNRPDDGGDPVPPSDRDPGLNAAQVESLATTAGPDGKNLLATLIPDYSQLAESTLSEVDIGFGARDQERVMRALHRLKGASANIGAAGAAKTCHELEHLAGQRQWSELGARIPQLRTIIKDSVALLTRHVPPLLGYTG